MPAGVALPPVTMAAHSISKLYLVKPGKDEVDLKSGAPGFKQPHLLAALLLSMSPSPISVECRPPAAKITSCHQRHGTRRIMRKSGRMAAGQRSALWMRFDRREVPISCRVVARECIIEEQEGRCEVQLVRPSHTVQCSSGQPWRTHCTSSSSSYESPPRIEAWPMCGSTRTFDHFLHTGEPGQDGHTSVSGPSTR